MVKEGRRPDKTTGRGEAPACYVDEDNNPDGRYLGTLYASKGRSSADGTDGKLYDDLQDITRHHGKHRVHFLTVHYGVLFVTN